MIEHDIDLASLTPRGQVVSSVRDGVLNMTVKHALPYSHCKPGLKNPHYMELPNRYFLPLRIDITAKIDAPALHLEIGNGFASFGVFKQDNRRLEDICEPKQKINHFDSHITMNEFNDISLIYGYVEMQILVNGEERYYSKSEPYMKSHMLAEMNNGGFTIKICCDKNVDMVIKSIKVTEYVGMAIILRPLTYETKTASSESVREAVAPSVGGCISGLPRDIASEVESLDEWLRSLRPLKFSRRVEKDCNKITYVASGYGFSYAIYPSDDVLYHQMQWYIVTNKKPELWARKDDRMEDVLKYIAISDPEYAGRMYGNLYECVNGRAGRCLAKTGYSFDGKRKITCHGAIRLKMSASDFNDARRFIGAFNDMLLEESANK